MRREKREKKAKSPGRRIALLEKRSKRKEIEKKGGTFARRRE